MSALALGDERSDRQLRSLRLTGSGTAAAKLNQPAMAVLSPNVATVAES